MITMTQLQDVGQPLNSETAAPELEDEVLQTLDHVQIAQVRQRAYGIMMAVTPRHRKLYDLPEEAAGVLWWTDGDPDDSSSGLNVVTSDEMARLEAVSTQAAIDTVVDHYNKNPGDDQHPAYRLYHLETDR